MKSYYCLEEDCYHHGEIDVIDLCEDIEEEEEEEDPIKSIMAKAGSLLMTLNQNRKKQIASMKRFDRRERTKNRVKTADEPGEVVQEGRAVWEADLNAETAINADREPKIKETFEPPVRGFPPRHWTAPSTSQPTHWTTPSTSQLTHWTTQSTSQLTELTTPSTSQPTTHGTAPSTSQPSAGATILPKKKRKGKRRIFNPDGSFRRVTVWKY